MKTYIKILIFLGLNCCVLNSASAEASKGICEWSWCTSEKASNNPPQASQKQSSADRVGAAVTILTPALQQWAADREAQRRKDEEESNKRQAEYDAKKKEEQDNFNQYVNQAKDDPNTNPWANSSKNQEQGKKRLDVNLGYCVEQNFSRQSNGKFALRNSCNFAINLKYTFSISKTFSGTYTTLRPNEMTFETGKENEKIKFMMCQVPKVPQTLDGGCI